MLRKSRDVSDVDKLILCGASAGRCAMCNDVIIQHHLTGDSGNFSQAAHIWAFSKKGPRGTVEGRPEDPDTLDNLIFLCHKCHKLIDTRPAEHPVASLIALRDQHYERVRHLTDCIPSQKTHVITLSARIGGQVNGIADDQIREAVRPLYPLEKPYPISYEPITSESPEQISGLASELEQQVNAFLTKRGASSVPVAVFAVAPIPLLVKMGRLLGNKVETRLFQFHRDPSSWSWKTDGNSVAFEVEKIVGGKGEKVALVVNVSGSNGPELLPDEYRDGNVYEIRPVGVATDRTLIRRAEDLVNFRRAYREALTKIAISHHPSEIGLFPAVPIPFAIAMGLDLLPKADPKLFIHDWRTNHFVPTITV